MRILGLDHGTRRIGVAVSDETKTIATPLEFIPAEAMDKVIERLQQLIRERDVELILIGMPRNMDGSYGPATEKVKEFIAAIQPHITTPVKTWDERSDLRDGQPRAPGRQHPARPAQAEGRQDGGGNSVAELSRQPANRLKGGAGINLELGNIGVESVLRKLGSRVLAQALFLSSMGPSIRIP